MQTATGIVWVQSVVSAVLLLGLLVRQPWVAAGAGALKLALWPWRAGLPLPLTVTRLGAGLVWPLAVWWTKPTLGAPV